MRKTTIANLFLMFIFFCVAPATGYSQLITIEPDDFAEGTDLRQISPLVTMSVFTSAGQTTFSVTSNFDGMGLASTGEMVFGHANVPFWNAERRLNLDFTDLISEVSLDFNGDFSLDPPVGILEIYDSQNNLIDFIETNPLSGSPETLTLTRGQGDIARAVAYSNNGPFLRLDNLSFRTSIPEPNTMIVMAVMSVVACSRRRRNRCQ